MILDALLAYAHFAAIFGTGVFLVLEWVRCREPVTANRARLLFRMDLAYFLFAMAALGTGLLRVFYGIKGPAFYLENPVFYVKLGVFAAVALLSLPVTFAYMRWNRAFRAGTGQIAPGEIRRARLFLGAELALLAVLPLPAVLMARGLGS